jgi:excisionase family DNA binding protein
VSAPASSSQATDVRLLSVRQVAELLNCSTRHVLRLADRGDMPAGLTLGHLRRWDRATVEAWVAGGCRPVRKGGRP